MMTEWSRTKIYSLLRKVSQKVPKFKGGVVDLESHHWNYNPNLYTIHRPKPCLLQIQFINQRTALQSSLWLVGIVHNKTFASSWKLSFVLLSNSEQYTVNTFNEWIYLREANSPQDLKYIEKSLLKSLRRPLLQMQMLFLKRYSSSRTTAGTELSLDLIDN